MPVALIVPEMLQGDDVPCVKLLREAGFDVRFPRNTQFARGKSSQTESIAELSVAHATIASSEGYSAAVLAALPDLRVIARCGVGYDGVEVPAASQRNIPVTITPNSNREAVAELALALLFGVTKSVVSNDKEVRAGNWPRKPLTPLRGKTMGIFGLGRIGGALASRAKALGLNVIATESMPDPEVVRELQIDIVDFDTLLAQSDIISLHCPLNDDTQGLFNASVFAKMKPNSILINTARGKVVNEADLISALQENQLGGAGLDVFEVEPPATDNPLLMLDNVVLSPHMGGVDEMSIEAMGLEAASCIIRLFRGEWPTGAVVNDQLKELWSAIES
ncbi:MAG: phosphoglycerate dehydrogenase [Pirellulaceae bacterium]|jgi:phosphoglycerate dehydrogenase-like enzyme|nr:phosphoglycerate dehydrogenase [Pirellulaceae bacterium]HJN08274.1 phosphoglycerate dehydrogenase [Pirellulaceae bacterium]